MTIIFALATLAVFYIWLKVRVGLLANERDRLQQYRLQLVQENNQLKAQVMNLASYERITKLAQEKLNLAFVRQEIISTQPTAPQKRTHRPDSLRGDYRK
ncbi:cell division protein FtsL [candidate division KSB1 bacterium]|nr:cell division protein FtsL [candidate division KSB1 bacterium]